MFWILLAFLFISYSICFLSNKLENVSCALFSTFCFYIKATVDIIALLFVEKLRFSCSQSTIALLSYLNTPCYRITHSFTCFCIREWIHFEQVYFASSYQTGTCNFKTFSSCRFSFSEWKSCLQSFVYKLYFFTVSFFSRSIEMDICIRYCFEGSVIHRMQIAISSSFYPFEKCMLNEPIFCFSPCLPKLWKVSSKMPK